MECTPRAERECETIKHTVKMDQAKFELQRKPAGIAIVGRLGAGKTTLSKYLTALLGWTELRMSAFLLELARTSQKPTTRRGLQDLGLELVKSRPLQLCQDALTYVCWKPGEGLIIDGLRDIVLFDAFKQLLNPMPCFLVFLRINEQDRLKRLSVRGHLEAQMHDEQHPIEQGIDLMQEKADIVLDASYTPEMLAKTLIAQLKKHLSSSQ